jgi:hypothetical protein
MRYAAVGHRSAVSQHPISGRRPMEIGGGPRHRRWHGAGRRAGGFRWEAIKRWPTVGWGVSVAPTPTASAGGEKLIPKCDRQEGRSPCRYRLSPSVTCQDIIAMSDRRPIRPPWWVDTRRARGRTYEAVSWKPR